MHIVLVEPDIAPNTGSIARLCVATGCPLHLVRPLGFQLTDKKLKRAGLDYWDDLDLKIWNSFQEFEENNDPRKFVLFSSHSKKLYIDIEYDEDNYLIYGAETTGLPDAIMKKYERQTATIPMWGPVRCLNQAQSVSATLYEALRQVRMPEPLSG